MAPRGILLDCSSLLGRLAEGVGRKLGVGIGKRFSDALQRRTAILWDGDLRCCQVFHTPFSAIAPAARRAPHLAQFVTIHDVTTLLHPEWMPAPAPVVAHQRALMQSISPAGWVLCDSDHTRNEFLRYCPKHPQEQVRTVYLAAGDEFRPCKDEGRIKLIRRKNGVPEEAVYFLSVCTLELRKNLTAAIKAFRSVIEQENAPDLYLLLGGARTFAWEEVLAAAEGAVRDRIIFTGRGSCNRL